MNRGPRRIAVAVFLGVVALAFVCWLLRADDERNPAGDSPATTDTSGSPPAEAAEASSPDSAPVRIVPQPFNEAALEVPVETLAQGRQLVVRERETGAPIPGATVHVYDAMSVDHDRLQASHLDRIDLEAAFHMRPRRFKSDASGMTIIPHDTSTSRMFVATAFAPARWGYVSIQPQSEGVQELLADPDCAVDLEVVHEDGSPAPGLAVSVHCARGPNSRAQWLSDEHGRLHIPSIGSVWRAMGQQPLHFTLAGMNVGESAACDPRSGKQETLRLVVPATAPLRMRLTGLDALPESSRSNLRVMVRTGQTVFTDWLATRLVGGIALTPPVPLGARLFVRCQTPLHELEECEFTVDAPAQRDDLHVLDVPIPPVRELLMAKLVDARGQAQRNARFQLQCFGAGPHEFTRWEYMTDSEGLLRSALVRGALKYPGRNEPVPVPPEPQRLLVMTVGKEDAATLGVEVPLPPTLVRGVNDLGTLTLVQPPLLVSGIVLDEQHAPVARAVVGASLNLKNEEGQLLGVEANYQTLSGADGRFSLRRFTRCRDLSVMCREDFSLPTMVQQVSVGATQVEFVLPRGSPLVGRVSLPAGLPAGALRVRVVSTNSSPLWQRESRPVLLTADGHFRTALLPPGSADVHFEDINGLSAPLATVRAVEVLAGVITRDARLDPFDLTAHTSALSITVRNKAGALLPGALVFARDDLHPGGHRCNETGVAAFFVPRLPQDLVVTAPGYQDLVLSAVTASREACLGAGILVDLHVDNARATDSPLFEQSGSVHWTAATLDPQTRGSTTAEQSGGDSLNPQILFPAAGLWKLSAGFAVNNNGRREDFLVPLAGEGVVRIPDGDGPHRIPISINEAFLQQLLRKK